MFGFVKRFQCSQQNESRPLVTFYQHIEEPMDTIVQINVGIAGIMGFDENSGTRTAPRVACGIINGQIGFGFDNPRTLSVPTKTTTDQFARAHQRVPSEE